MNFEKRCVFMKLGVTSGSYARFGEDRYQRMKEHGYDYCDLNLANTNLPFYHCSEEELTVMIADEKKLAEEAGISFCQIHGPWRHPPRDTTAEERAERKEKMLRSLQIAGLLGSKYVVIHPIMPFGAKDWIEPERTFQMNVDFFRALIPEAKKWGVGIAIENMPMRSFPLATPEAVLKMVEAVDDPTVQVCLDTGHCAVVEMQPGAAVRQLGDRLKVLHVHDNNGKSDLHMIPYTGVINWEDFAAALKETGFSGVFSVESSAPKAQVNTEAALALTGATALIARQIAEMTE